MCCGVSVNISCVSIVYAPVYDEMCTKKVLFRKGDFVFVYFLCIIIYCFRGFVSCLDGVNCLISVFSHCKC